MQTYCIHTENNDNCPYKTHRKGSRVQILLSAEEHNLSPFDLNIACLCQSIEINNNKYVYRQSQMRKSTDSGVKWAECSLIIGTGCRVFSLILDSSVGLSASIQSAGDLVAGIPGSNPALSRGTQLAATNLSVCLSVGLSSSWHNILTIFSTSWCISEFTGWAIIEELSIRPRLRTFLISWGKKTRVKHCYVDLSSWYEL